jgi:uncharacterized protein
MKRILFLNWIVCLFFLLLICSPLFSQIIDKEFVQFKYPSGIVSSEGYMIDGKPDGFWKSYYPTGVLKSEGRRVNFLLDSTWVFFNERGDTTEIINYLNGRKNGYYIKFTNTKDTSNIYKNRLESKELFVNDLREGDVTLFHENGNIRETIPYVYGKRVGTGFEFNENGLVQAVNIYRNDVLSRRENINRVDRNGHKQGVWKTFHENKQVRVFSEYKDDLLHGLYREYDERGTLVLNLRYSQGRLVENRLDSDENVKVLTVVEDNGRKTRVGSFKSDSVPVGIHRYFDVNGDLIDSKIYNELGNVVGQGIITDEGVRTGFWKFFYDSGELRAEGMYSNNRQNGSWIFYYRDGGKEQEGNFSNGFFDGVWTWFYKNGVKLKEEEYLRGKEDGVFVEFNDSGDTISFGNYSEGEKNGYWIFKAGDVTERGNYVNGLKDGMWKSFYDDGVLYHEGNFIQGVPDGKHKLYFPSGVLREEQIYVMGRKDKNWRKYSEDGLMYLLITYENDIEVKINGVRINMR